MKTFKKWIEAIESSKPLEDIKKYHTRWMIRRDFPEVLEFLKTHPDFAGDSGLEKKLIAILREENAIGIVAYDEKDIIVGLMVYLLETGHMASPLIMAKDYDVAHNMIDMFKRKFEKRQEHTNRLALYVRAPLEDRHVLNALKDHGFETKIDKSGMVHGQYPRTNIKHKGLFDKYLDIIQGSEVTEPKSSIEDDDFGLFRDKPWKK